ncbi:MAG: S41 family peptidase [Candidatus Harrisonbacteria bacterium]|nr:S41 family peptidase [Candidatus Harrisonbacteria bacterium]
MLSVLKTKFGKAAVAAAAVLIIAGITGSAFYFGYQVGTGNPKKILAEDLTGTNFGIFWEAWELLKKEHLKGAEAKNQDLVYGAIRGLVNSLNDPHTVFFPPDDSKKFEEDVNGSFGGIGAEIGTRNNQLVIIAPLKNTPAEKAGLKAGDKILAIGEKSTEGLDVNEAVKKIRGTAGTEIVLTIFRENWNAPKDIKLTRAVIEVPTIESKIIEPGIAGAESGQDGILAVKNKKIAHISLFAFNQNAPLAFYKEAIRALLGGADGLILDLRNNPGGFLEVATNLAGWFLDRGEVIVTEKFRSGEEIVFRANGNGALKNLPTVILVNKGSASASEILAGALRVKRGIKIVGTQTFGKGTVQELKSLSDGSRIKLTIANWVLPDGTVIDEKGLKPDFEVEIKEETEKKDAKPADPQLEKAVEILLDELVQ